MSATSRKAAKRLARKAEREEKKKRWNPVFMREQFNDFIGARIMRISDDEIVAVKDGKVFRFGFQTEGSFSDWWEVESKLLIPKNELKNAPAITGIKLDGKKFILTIFGLNKAICEMQATFHNDSGWDYGCTCEVYCNAKQLALWHG